MAEKVVLPQKLGEATTQTIHKSRTSDVLLPSKVENKYPLGDFTNLFYPRLSYKILEPESRDILFSIVHGLVYNKTEYSSKERVQDPYCLLPECQNKIQDLEYLFGLTFGPFFLFSSPLGEQKVTLIFFQSQVIFLIKYTSIEY